MRFVFMVKFTDHINYIQFGETETLEDSWDYDKYLREKYGDEIEDIQVIKEY